MKSPLARLLVGTLVLVPLTSLAAQGPAAAPAAARTTRQMTPTDLKAWRTIRNASLSSDGRWFGYVLAPNEGDASVVLRSTRDSTKEWRFPIGSAPAAGGGGAAAAAGTPLVVTGDGRWAVFTIYPTMAEARRARTARRTLYNRVAVVNLESGEKREFERIRRFMLNGDVAQWVAMQTYPADAPAAAPAAAGATPAAGRADGTDLVLVQLGGADVVNVGNVNEFEFDESGRWLAYTIDAREQLGNGVQLRDMTTGVVKLLDGSRGLYRRLAWADSAPMLAVLRGRVDTVARDTSYALVTVAVAPTVKTTTLDPAAARDFPKGMRIATDRPLRIASDLSAVFFGIREAAKPAARRPNGAADPRPSSVVAAGAPGAGGTINQPRLGADAEDETPSLILWHWKDPRLQSQQIVQEQADRAYSYLAEYRLDGTFIRLADDALRNVTILPKERFALGTDIRDYQQQASYSGRGYSDVYAIDLRTGARTSVIKKQASSLMLPSPDGTQALYWGQDGHWYVLDVATGASRNVTRGVPVSFADDDDDHNNLYPPANAAFGWSRDGSAVLLSDGWDAWLVPTKGGAATNLTGDGRTRKVRYQRLQTFDGPPPGSRRAASASTQGVDLRKPLYFATYGEWTKKSGLSRVQPGKAGATSLVWDDANFNVQRARNADTFVYTRQTALEMPNYWVAGSDFKGRRLTDANPEQSTYAWSSGTRLIDYVTEKGDTLQGALYLPANYEPGKKYPLLVTIYEKRSQNANVFVNPNETSTPNRSLYTSRGYAVLDPDIVYKVNDPGMSAVWSVVPAVKAAIATGIVDSANVGLWGHSWGGYQTAFLVTQTNLFKSAIAGAPLTDMVSMYSSIYWNTGGTNQAIFESSQGRFKGNYADNLEAYLRNSPVFHAKEVKTPLVILHNDKDGAVDFNQGITYYNTLRQMGKDVILLEYAGENHGLARPVNQKDYAVRMREWFDAYLKGAPAPEWMTNGIPRLQMADHLKARAAEEPPPPPPVVP